MIFNKKIRVGSTLISEESPVFIIAEAGVNHNGDMAKAKQLIDVASAAGADAVKFQAFRTEHLIVDSVEKAPYQQKTTKPNESQKEMLKKLELTRAQNLELVEYAKKKNIIFLTTPFDEVSLDELDELNLPAYKVASTDITNLPFLEKIAAKGKPIFLSTGMSYLSEVQLALETIYPLNKDLVLLQCTANYPISDAEANLNVIQTYRKHFDVLLGYSDHTVGLGAAPYAIPMGARVIEKHFTLDKNLPGPDHKASLSPQELKELVRLVRRIESFLGDGIKRPSVSETQTRKSLQKCLVAKSPIKKGELFTKENLVGKRTGGKGISPIYFSDILGKPAPRDFNKDDIISL